MLEKRTVSQCISSDYCKGWNDAVDEMPKWIDVKEKLPENHMNCLVYYRHTCSNIDGYRVVGVSYYNDEKFLIECIGQVTHWMPLPEPPEEGVQNG